MERLAGDNSGVYAACQGSHRIRAFAYRGAGDLRELNGENKVHTSQELEIVRQLLSPLLLFFPPGFT